MCSFVLSAVGFEFAHLDLRSVFEHALKNGGGGGGGGGDGKINKMKAYSVEREHVLVKKSSI